MNTPQLICASTCEFHQSSQNHEAGVPNFERSFIIHATVVRITGETGDGIISVTRLCDRVINHLQQVPTFFGFRSIKFVVRSKVNHLQGVKYYFF